MMERYPITARGKMLLEEKLHAMRDRVPVVRDEIIEAQKKGDFSENFEYYAAKKELRELEHQIDDLDKHIRTTIVVSIPISPKAVCFGCKVHLKKDGVELSYIILGERESEPIIGSLSTGSPLFRALVAKKPGDIISFNESTYEIISVQSVSEQEINQVIKV